MGFKPAAWQSRHARVALAQWNATHHERLIPWEWVEECLLAWRAWKEQMSYAPEEAEKAKNRYTEFEQRIPAALIGEIFPKGREGEGGG